MIKSVEELQNLIVWLKKERVKSLKVGEIIVELSDYAFIEQLTDASGPTSNPTEESKAAKATPQNELNVPGTDESDEDILFHSSRP